MKVKSLQDLFETGLKYAYDCEQKLVRKGIPNMIKASNSTELRNALEQHLEETRSHVTRLERVFNACGIEADTKDNDIIDEITDSAEDMIGWTEDGSPLRDAALIVEGHEVTRRSRSAMSVAFFILQKDRQALGPVFSATRHPCCRR